MQYAVLNYFIMNHTLSFVTAKSHTTQFTHLKYIIPWRGWNLTRNCAILTELFSLMIIVLPAPDQAEHLTTSTAGQGLGAFLVRLNYGHSEKCASIAGTDNTWHSQ